jgi:hypothetical protein
VRSRNALSVLSLAGFLVLAVGSADDESSSSSSSSSKKTTSSQKKKAKKKERKKTTRSSSRKTQSRVINPAQAEILLRGCCTGAGGTYSPSHQDCIQPNREAFSGCIGSNVSVEYPSGKTHRLTPSKFIR